MDCVYAFPKEGLYIRHGVAVQVLDKEQRKLTINLARMIADGHTVPLFFRRSYLQPLTQALSSTMDDDGVAFVHAGAGVGEVEEYEGNSSDEDTQPPEPPSPYVSSDEEGGAGEGGESGGGSADTNEGGQVYW
jgi:hypothetical protein